MRHLSLILAGFLLLTLSASAWSQGDTMQPPAGGGPQGGMMGGMSMQDMMRMMATMHPAVAVDNTAIYIVRGSEVLKLDKNTLQVIAKAQLPAPEGQMAGMAGGTVGSGPGMAAMRPQMQQMMTRMQQMQPAQFEQSFMQNMIRHHEGAIAMSRVAVKKAVHPELRQFAQNVITNQSTEIQEMSGWLKSWYRLSATMSPMPMDQQMTTQLRGLEGRDFEIRYMQAMIMHHQDGVSMAQLAIQKATHQELRTLASNIVTKQQAEIAQLKGWLSAWYDISS